MDRDASAITRDAPRLRVAQVVPCTEAEGPGRRFAIWVQGCPLRCPGCYAYDDNHLGGGVTLRQLRDLKGDALVDGVLALVRKHRPVQVSFVGGEPLLRHRELSRILPVVSDMGIYSLVVTSAVSAFPLEWNAIPRVRVAVSIDWGPGVAFNGTVGVRYQVGAGELVSDAWQGAGSATYRDDGRMFVGELLRSNNPSFHAEVASGGPSSRRLIFKASLEGLREAIGKVKCRAAY